jgi:hypothetical protein
VIYQGVKEDVQEYNNTMMTIAIESKREVLLSLSSSQRKQRPGAQIDPHVP